MLKEIGGGVTRIFASPVNSQKVILDEKIYRRTAVRPLIVAIFGLALAYGGGLWLQLLHAFGGAHEINEPPFLLHWLRDSSLGLPLALFAAWLGLRLARPALARFGQPGMTFLNNAVAATLLALLASGIMAAAQPLHTYLFDAHHAGHELAWYLHMLRDGLLVLLVNFPLAALLVFLLRGRFWQVAPQGGFIRHWKLGRRLFYLGLSLIMLSNTFFPVLPIGNSLPEALAATACTVTRSYDVAAISLTIPLNRWGDADNDGMIYVLQGDKHAVKNWSLPLNPNPAEDPANNRRLRPRPLVLRANAGECVSVTLTNELNPVAMGGLLINPRASMHINGPSYNPQTSDGAAVGYNQDTTIAIGEKITYKWLAPKKEGLYFFYDQATPAGSESNGGSNSHGLYGALAVEPAGSTWLDPVSGQPLYTGTTTQSGDLYIDAMIKPPAGKMFRESVQLGQDEVPHNTLTGSSMFSFNYGSEPQMNREGANRCPDCLSEESSLSSWVYGDPSLIKLASGLGPWKPDYSTTDPAKIEDCGLPGSCYVANVFHTYDGDPTKIRYGMAGTKETHVFHMHAHQWLAEPFDGGPNPSAPPSDANMPASNTIDSQTFGPQEMFTADLLWGAGSKPGANGRGAIGDTIFHCHLYSHFAEGFWALMRVHDVLEDGTGYTPDGIRVRALIPLSDRTPLAAPTVNNPGFPRFVPGQFGWRAPQPPLAITQNGPNGPAAPRIVAGKAPDPAKVAIEQNVIKLLNNNGPGKPGAPFHDPCPAGSREITYNVSVIQRDLVYNEAGWHDTQARILVLDQDVDAIMAGTKPIEPFFMRANAGDCINFNLTNRLPNWLGNDAFQQLVQTNLVGEHIHLVKFDVLASDGSTNGWNYLEAAFSRDQADFNNKVLAGTATCDPTMGMAPGCRLPNPANWDPKTTSSAATVGQTIHERWFADYELRTVFTHDHHFPAVAQGRGFYGALVVEPKGVDIRNPKTGVYMQPINQAGHGTVCTTSCLATAVGTKVDIIGPGSKDDFREFSLAVADFVPLTRAGGNPQLASDVLNSPVAPERFGSNDPGVMAINYRNAPLSLRQTKNGLPVDPAYQFSSWVFGDPMTPLLEAYAGDAVRFRLIQGSQEENHMFGIHGLRWKREPSDPQSALVSAIPVGISEAFNLDLPSRDCAGAMVLTCYGDYFYSSMALDDTYLGMWGIMRVHFDADPSRLLPLPDNMLPDRITNPVFKATGVPPSQVPLAMQNNTLSCPKAAPLRTYSVVAMEKALTYNEAGDNDPYGLMYALAEDEAALKAGTKKPEPLVLRANVGDCIKVTLTNKLTTNFLNHKGATDGDPHLPTEPSLGTKAGLRVSLHPQLVSYDIVSGDGATVGFNFDQTAGPGQSFTYMWYADEVTPGELGAANLLDFGDVRGHRHHGLFGGLIIEPKGATYHDPLTGNQIKSGGSADIRLPNAPDFREFTLFYQDGLNLRDKKGAIILDSADHGPASLDPEDQGEKGFNYNNAPFMRRLGVDPSTVTAANPLDGTRMSQIFSSTAISPVTGQPYGDPATPIFRAYSGDAVRIRVLQGSDKPRNHGFRLGGHGWMVEPNDPGSNFVGAEGGISSGRSLNIHLNKAGGEDAYPGDYKYDDTALFQNQAGGLWGLMRVYPAPGTAVSRPDALKTQDNPYLANYRPLMSLELPVVAVATLASTSTSTPEATPTPTPEATSTSTPEATSTPTPDATSTPKPTNPAGTTASPAAPTAWTTTTGTVAWGNVTQLAARDRKYLVLSSKAAGGKQAVDGYGSYTVPADQRNLLGLSVSYVGGSSASALSRTLYLYNFTTKTWEALKTEVQQKADLQTALTVSGDPLRFISTTGEIRLRVAFTGFAAFKINTDQITFTVTY